MLKITLAFLSLAFVGVTSASAQTANDQAYQACMAHVFDRYSSSRGQCQSKSGSEYTQCVNNANYMYQQGMLDCNNIKLSYIGRKTYFTPEDKHA